MSPDDLRQQIELRIVEMIKQSLEAGLMTESRAQAISQHVLVTLRPGMTLEEIYRAVPRLDDSYPELAPIISPLLRSYEKNIAQQAVKPVAELIRIGQYDAAITLASRAINQQVKLTWEGSAKARTGTAG